MHISWSVYTMAKGHVHSIVKGLETHPKDIPWKSGIAIYVVTMLKCSVKTYATGLSTKCVSRLCF